MFLSFGLKAQVPVPRGPATVLERDARIQGYLNLVVPRYADTTAANTQKGLDSLGAVVYTNADTTIWVRGVSANGTHIWRRVSTGSSVTLPSSYYQSGLYAFNDSTVRLGHNAFLENVHFDGSNTYSLYLDSLLPITPNDNVTDKALTWDIGTHQLKSIFRYVPHIQRFFYDTATTTQTAISGLQTVKLSTGQLVGVATGSGTNPSDGASSSLWAYDSYDNGHTFVNKRNIIPLSGVSGALAIYTPSIVLIPGDTLLMVFTVATATGPTYVSSLWQSKSYRGISWSAPIKIYDGGGSKYLNDASGRMIRTFKGTIIQPFEIWRFDPVLSPNSTSGFDGALAISNDNGSHWNVHTNVFVAPDSGWVESGLYQTNDSILWAYARSPRGGWAVGSYCTTNDTSYATWTSVYRLNLPNPNANVYIYHNPYNDILIAATNEITLFPQGSDRHKLVLSELAYSQHNKDGHNRPAVTNSNWIWKQVCILDTALGSGQMFGVNQIRNLNDTAYEMNYISLSSTNAWISMKAAIVPVTYFPTEFKEYNPEFDPQLYLHRHKDSLGQQMIILDWENNYTDNTKNHPRWVYSLSNNVNSATTFTPSLQSSSSSNSLSGLVTNIDDSASSVATSIWDINTNAIGLQETTLPLIHLHTAGLNVLDINANTMKHYGTGGFQLPTGTTAQRSTLASGLRFNSTLTQFEAYSTEHSNNSWATMWMSGTGLQTDANIKQMNLTSVGEAGTITFQNADASTSNFNTLQFKKSVSGSFNIGTSTPVGQIDLSTMAQLRWIGSPNTTGGLTTLDMIYRAYNAAGAINERFRVTAEGGVYIGTGAPTIDPASLLTLTSTTQGFRPPSMTASQMTSISSPTAGTMVFNSDANDFYGRENGAWTPINSQGIMRYVAKTTTYGIGQFDYYIDCTSGSFTVTLPSAVTVGAGKNYIIKNSGTATTITIATTSSQTIDGSAPGVLTGTLIPLRVISDGANWKSW
jgi:hypothetical protein